MLTIRKEQMEVFNKAQRRRFEDRMLAHLRRYFREETESVPEALLRQRIRSEVDTAAHYHIIEEYDVAVYICILFALHPDLPIAPPLAWVQDILSDRDVLPSEKVQLLRHLAEAELKGQSDG